ncbi:MAG: hypothetical protein K0R65_2931 [Crocinitomicaceae bacterium]|jgi:hypothetical protein|nr:hypothetical protein [Crocinitomicaceae bacterium]
MAKNAPDSVLAEFRDVAYLLDFLKFWHEMAWF